VTLQKLLLIQKNSQFESRIEGAKKTVGIIYPLSIYQPKNIYWSPGDPMTFSYKKPTTFKLQTCSKKEPSKGNWIVLVHLEELNENGEIAVRCNCPDFKFRLMNALHYHNLLYGRVMPKSFEKRPVKTNPNMIPAMCKHILASIDQLLYHELIYWSIRMTRHEHPMKNIGPMS
jgi:hypothetical protein